MLPHHPHQLITARAETTLATLLLSADPAYPIWADSRQQDDTAAFDTWLASPAGQAWLDNESDRDLEARCLSEWRGW